MRPYYQDSAVTIYHADCTEFLPSSEVSAIITDPPYGVGVKYGDETNDSRLDYWEWMRSAVSRLRSFCPIVGMTHRVRALSELVEWDWVAVWYKPMSFGCRAGNSPVLPHWEPILLWGIFGIGTKGEVFPDVITCNPEKAGGNGLMGREKWENDSLAEHPCPKPLKLMSKIINPLVREGETVMDPFCGTGTTLRAAKESGRKAIGIEIEERYCEIAAKRMQQEVLPLVKHPEPEQQTLVGT